MQQEHFGKYSALEQGKSWADRQVLTSLTAQSLSRLLIPPDINSRLCFTFTSICRERRRLQKLSAISDFSLFLSKLSLMAPPLCLPLPFHTLSHFFCLSLPPPHLPPHSVCDPFLRLCWDFLLSPPLQPYSLSSLHLKFICKHGPVQRGCTSRPAKSNPHSVLFNFLFIRSGSYLPGEMSHLSGWENIPLHLCGCSHLCWYRPDLFTLSVQRRSFFALPECMLWLPMAFPIHLWPYKAFQSLFN